MDKILLIDVLLVAVTLALFMAVLSYVGWEFNRLHHHGRRIIATITDISYGIGNSTSRFSRDHPYVTARWIDPGTGRSYTFWQLAAENKPFYKIGNLVPVLIDPNHPKYYAMEI
jgi:hypothetical protein